MYQGLNATLQGKRRLNIDSSSRCNLLCPGCYRTRTVSAEDKPWQIMDMPMEYFQSLVRPENKLDALTYNLTLSDPIYSGVFLEQLEYLSKQDNPPRIFISTNGSGRKEKYWRKLAKLLKPRDVIEFAVDGLEDTNHIYRVNAKWDSIINGMRVVKEYGKCSVGWRFIVFEHNYHQVDEARQQAKLLHLDKFHVILGDNRTPDSMRLRSASFDDIS